MLTPGQFQRKIKEERGIILSYQSILRNVRFNKIKSVKKIVGNSTRYMIPEQEIENLRVRYLVI